MEKEPLGNAGALFFLDLKEDFLLLNADAAFDVDFNRMLNFMIMLNNDGRIVNSEVNALLINLGFIGICGVYMYLIYLLTYKKFKKIIGIL